MAKRALSLLLAFACLILATGCWDQIELHNLLIVAGIGLDLDEKTGLYHATVEIVNPQANGGENIEAEIVEADGDTIYSAAQNAMMMAGGTMFGNHCKVIVIGESLARQGINDVVDFVLRDPDFRKTLDVMVAKTDTAKTILTSKTVKNDIVSYELGKILQSDYKNINNTISPGMYKLHEAFISPCPAAVIPTVTTVKKDEESVLLIDGVALFSGDRLHGFLSGEQCRIYNIATRSLERGYLITEDAALSPNPVGAKITRSRVKYTPRIFDGALSMLVSIQADVVLDGSAELNADLSDKDSIEMVQKSFENQLNMDTKALVTTVQSKYGADVFDFYKEFENHYRNEWQALQVDWREHFKKLEIQVVSDVRITGSGLIGGYAPNQGNSLSANALP